MPNVEFSKSDFEVSLRDGECIRIRGITGHTLETIEKSEGRYVCFRNGKIM